MGSLRERARAAAQSTVIVASDLTYALAFCTGRRRLAGLARALERLERRYLR